jgi:hypothetical protein
MAFKNDPISTVLVSVKAGPKSKAIEILKVHMAFTLTKTVEIGSFLKASIQIWPD